MNFDLIRPTRSGEGPEIGSVEIRRQIGKELKTAREVQQMSLEQVMAITKINFRYLEGLELGKWSFLPPIYVKAFIQSYAGVVGLLSDKLSRQLDDIFEPVSMGPVRENLIADECDVATSGKTGDKPGVSAWTDHNRSLIFYGTAAVILAILVALYIFRPVKSPVDLPQARRARTSIADTEKTNSAPAVTVTPAAIDTTKRAIFELQVLVNDTSYVRIAQGDSLLYERTLWPGNNLKFNPTEPVLVSLGNAPGVSLVLNGTALPAFPTDVRVRTVKVGPQGIIN